MSTPNPLAVLALDDLRRRTSQKWRTYDADVLPLWIAEMDVPQAPAVIDALTRAIADGDTGYPMPSEYVQAVARFAARRWGWGFDPASASGVADVMSGIAEILRGVTRPGDGVVVSPPVYPPFFDVVRHTGRRVVEAPLGDDGRLDLDALDRAFSGSAAYLLCSPHNPTGTVPTRTELEGVATLAARHGVRVIADEIHAPLVLAGHEHVPYLSLPGTRDAFALLSASKGWNLAGLKAAVAVAGEDGVDVLRAWPHMVTDAPTHLGVIAQRAAMAGGLEWLDAVVAGIDANADRLVELLADHAPAVRTRRIEGTYLGWLDFRATDLGVDPAARLVERGQVALSPGLWFGRQGAGHARINLATSPAILEEAVRRIGGALRGGG